MRLCGNRLSETRGDWVLLVRADIAWYRRYGQKLEPYGRVESTDLDRNLNVVVPPGSPCPRLCDRV